MDSTQAWIERGRPAHVAIIMDGNGRWARSRGLARSAGHRRGATALRRAVKAAIELGLDCLTVFAFSAENWHRPAREVDGLMGLLRHYLKGEIGELHANGVCLRFIGARERLPADIVALIDEAEARTRDNDELTLVVALSYGGRQAAGGGDEFLTPAVAERHHQGELAVVAGAGFGLVDQRDDVGRQALARADEPQAHAVSMELADLPLEVVAQQPHEAVDLARRAVPVLRRKGEDRQAVEAQLEGRSHGPAQRLGATAVARRTWQTAAARPAAVAVHDDRHVGRPAALNPGLGGVHGVSLSGPAG